VDAPITGNVWKIEAAEGELVEAGQVIAVIEAMKMEIRVVAPVRGRVWQIRCEAGRLVQSGQPLAILTIER
jgi:urea carboxylase